MKPALTLLAAAVLAAPAAAQKAVPYWASIGPTEARTRSGPGREFPAVWLYKRAGLPVEVIETYPNWRKLRDPDGAVGWMQANMVSERRTGMVRGGVAELLEKPQAGARVAWRAAPGVIGTIAKCSDGWCLLDVRGKAGWLPAGRLWGVGATESLP